VSTFVYERPVRFEDVDAARIVFFPRFLGYCHEAMEAMLAPLEGGYAALVVQRQIGMPAVRVEADFSSPLRFGDIVRIEVVVEHVGRTSCTIRYELFDAKTRQLSARVRHIVVLSDLRVVQKVPIPDDVRAILERHSASPASSSKL
jgi:4-hydroxybenzoyl-CoA thioesterase